VNSDSSTSTSSTEATPQKQPQPPAIQSARADQSAHQVLRRPEVQRRIQQRIAESRGTADEFIGTLASFIRGTLADFLDESGDSALRLPDNVTCSRSATFRPRTSVDRFSRAQCLPMSTPPTIRRHEPGHQNLNVYQCHRHPRAHSLGIMSTDMISITFSVAFLARPYRPRPVSRTVGP